MLCEYAFNEKYELVHVDSVPNGLDCNCTCPCCGEKMIARQGKINEHCFAHSSGAECKGYYETLMHILAKEIIAEEKCVMLQTAEILQFTNIETEKTVINNLRPDIIGFNDESELWIEIAVTHKCDEQKIQTIIENNINCIEIEIPKNINNKNELREFLINSPNNRHYINEQIHLHKHHDELLIPIIEEKHKLQNQKEIENNKFDFDEEIYNSYDKYPKLGKTWYEMCKYWKNQNIIGFTAKDRRERYLPHYVQF